MAIPIVRLKRGKARPFWHGNPIVFSGAIASEEGKPRPGDWVEVRDDEDRSVGHGFYNPASSYRVRLVRLAREERLPDSPEGVIKARLQSAAALRGDLGLPGDDTNSYRLVNSEGDGLSGLTVEVFGDVAVIQASALWVGSHRQAIEAGIRDVLGVETRMVHRVSASVARQEGMKADLPAESGESVTVRELGLTYRVEPWRGQKTGFYLDQRENRQRVRNLARNRRVLDLFCFQGAFSLNAAAGGATEVVGVDSSRPALDLAAQNAANNGAGQVRFELGDAIAFASSAGTWDLVICDPPRLAGGRADLESAVPRYVRVNRAAIDAVAPGGFLVTCSCSSVVRRDLFLEIVRDAAAQAGRRASVLEVSGAGRDHPVHAAYPEGEYLKCVTARLD